MFEKQPDRQPNVDVEATPEWIDEQCKAFEATLLGFAQEMRERFRIKAGQGRGRWQRAEFAGGLYQAMLAHAASAPLAVGQEADCANYLAFLWRLNRENPQATTVRAGPIAMRGGYGLQADVELVRQVLELVGAELAAAGADAKAEQIRGFDPSVVIAAVNEKLAL